MNKLECSIRTVPPINACYAATTRRLFLVTIPAWYLGRSILLIGQKNRYRNKSVTSSYFVQSALAVIWASLNFKTNPAKGKFYPKMAVTR
jgi:hypothetical protein